MKKQTVGVIVPVFNREKLVVRCLDSILHQSVRPDELIVVDNNSSDSSFSVVENWMETNKNSGIVFKLLREEKKGACEARYKGEVNAESDLVIFFDSDDEMHPELIEKSKKEFDKDSQTNLVCWKSEIKLLDGSKRVPPFKWKNPVEGHLIHTLLRPQGYMIQKEILEQSGGWSKSVKVWNDFELGLRILFQYPKIKAIPEILSMIYSQEESITGKDFSSKEGVWEKTLNEMQKETDKSDHPEKTKIFKILDYRRAILSAHYYREGNKKGAKTLMVETLKNKGWFERIILNFSYRFTRMGLRGVWRLVRFAY